MAKPLTKGAGYLSPAFAPSLKFMAADLRVVVKNHPVDTLIGTGLSGALVVPYLGRALRKNWGVVRKPGDSAHSRHLFEGTLGARWMLVDDLVDTGKTVKRVVEAIQELKDVTGHETEFIGMWGYDDTFGGWYGLEALDRKYRVTLS